MSKGSKDWVSQTNLTLQEITQLVVRTKYGAVQKIGFTGTVSAGWNWLIDGICQGVIYGGYTIFKDAGAGMRMTLDNGDPITFSFIETLASFKTAPTLPFFQALQFSPAESRYTVGLGMGVTFESRFYLEVYAPADGMELQGEVYYAVI